LVISYQGLASSIRFRRFPGLVAARISPDMDADEVIRLETGWKDRLHTRRKFGLNGQ
jgi:hypothetical protein